MKILDLISFRITFKEVKIIAEKWQTFSEKGKPVAFYLFSFLSDLVAFEN